MKEREFLFLPKRIEMFELPNYKQTGPLEKLGQIR